MKPEPEPQPQPDEPSVSQADPSASHTDQDVVVELVGTCTIGSTVTPIRLRLMGYFSRLLQKNKENKSRPTDKRKVKPRFYGEALTVDDVYQQLAEEEREKEETRKRKAMKARSSTRLTGSKVARKKSSRQGRTKRRRKVCIYTLKP